MKIRRTPFAMTIAAMSLGLLAACSDEADQAADAPVGQATPAPEKAPTDNAPRPAPAPDAGNTKRAPVEGASPASGSGATSMTDPGSSVPDTAPGGSTPGNSGG